jgi:hypothetical protein
LRWEHRRPAAPAAALANSGEGTSGSGCLGGGALRCSREEGAGWRSGDKRQVGGGAPTAVLLARGGEHTDGTRRADRRF